MIVRYLLDDFLNDIEHKEVAFIGTGKKMEEVYPYLLKFGIEDKVFGLADNNKEKQNTVKAVGNRKYTILSVDELIRSGVSLIYIISIADFEPVLKQLNSFPQLEYEVCYLGACLLGNENTKRLSYVADLNQKLLTGAPDRKREKNIGACGKNLTISILSCNRSELTAKLLYSIQEYIPDFQGEILVGDNGSEEQELNLLRKTVLSFPFNIKLIEFGRNLGVAGGRNRLAQAAGKGWIFQIDNDMYFIRNPLEKLQEEIALLGCHFLSVPYWNKSDERVYSYGGYLEVKSDQDNTFVRQRYLEYPYEITGGKEEAAPILCNYVSGGAVIFKKDTFLRMEGYDRNMFVGYEDIEFALRVFKEGYKVGSAGAVCMVHNHKKAETREEHTYEKIRNCFAEIEKSVDVLEKKHGVKVWTEEERKKKITLWEKEMRGDFI